MKKRLLFLLLAMVGMTLQSMAQYIADVPKFSKLLTVTSKGVNIRQEPSATSPKMGSNPKYLFVIDETPEWYYACILKDGNIMSRPGYISKKACKTKCPPSVNATYVKNSFPDHQLVVKTRQTGKYKGYTTISFYYFNLGWSRYYLFIGKPFNNTYIGKLYRYDSYGEGYVAIRRAESQDDRELKVPDSRGLIGENGDDFSKLNDNEIEKLWSFGDPNKLTVLYADKVEFEYRNGMDPNTKESGPGVETYEFDSYGYEGETVQIGKVAATEASVKTGTANDSEVFDRVEQMPSFPGGASALRQYLSNELKYPAICLKNNIQGRVVVSFVVNRDGSISDAKIVRSIDPALDKEALRVVSGMPNWNPGKIDGKNVRVKYTIPINFQK